MYSQRYKRDLSSTSLPIDVKDASLSITEMLQDSSMAEFDTKESLVDILERVSGSLLSRKIPFEEDIEIKGLLDVISAIMRCQCHLTTACLLLLSFKITAILSGEALISTSKAIELVQLLSRAICIPWLTEYQRTQGYYYIFLSLENSDLVQYCVIDNCQYILSYGNIYDNQEAARDRKTCESIRQQQKFILSRIAQRLEVFKTCQEIKRSTHRLIDLTISGNDNYRYKDRNTNTIHEILTQLSHYFNLLMKELTMLHVLEQLDELKYGDFKIHSSLTECIGVLVPYQVMSSIPFRVFGRFQTYDCLIITAVLTLLHDGDIILQFRCIISLMKFIIAQMSSRQGRFHIEEDFTSLPSLETKKVINWISADITRRKRIGGQMLDPSFTLYDMWKELVPLMQRRLDVFYIFTLKCRIQTAELNLNEMVQRDGDGLLNNNYIKCWCNEILGCSASNLEVLDWVVQTDLSKVGGLLGHMQHELSAEIDATANSKRIRELGKSANPTEYIHYGLSKSTLGNPLQALTKLSHAGEQAVKRSFLDFDLIPDLVKAMSSEENEYRRNATVLIQELFERPNTVYWLLQNDILFRMQELLSKNYEVMKHIEITLACQSIGIVNSVRRCRNRLLDIDGSIMADGNLIDLKQLLNYGQLFRLNDMLQLSELVEMQTLFLSNLQAEVDTNLLERLITPDDARTHGCNDKTSKMGPTVQRTMTVKDDLYSGIHYLCEALGILTQLIRQTCAYLPHCGSPGATGTNPLDNNNFLAILLIDAALNTLCTIYEVSEIITNVSNGDRQFDILKEISTVEVEVYILLHDQCSISISIEDGNEGWSPQTVLETYETLGIAPNFPRYIIEHALKLIHRKPSSLLPLLKLICDILPDAVNSDLSSLTLASQQLRSYWKNVMTEVADDLLSLRHFIISNDYIISEAAGIAMAKVCRLFSPTNWFHRRIKSVLYQEMNVAVGYAINSHSTNAVATHKRLGLMQNEVILRRWLNFTAMLPELEDIHAYFTQALAHIKLPVEMMESFTAPDSMLVKINIDSIIATLHKTTSFINERNEFYKENDGNTGDTMFPTNQSNNKINIGGGKAYNRNEFRAVHGFQSVNASRPPSVHVDDFSNLQS